MAGAPQTSITWLRLTRWQVVFDDGGDRAAEEDGVPLVLLALAFPARAEAVFMMEWGWDSGGSDAESSAGGTKGDSGSDLLDGADDAAGSRSA